MTLIRTTENFLTLVEKAFLAIANGLLFAMLAINFVNIAITLHFRLRGVIWTFPAHRSILRLGNLLFRSS